MKRARLALALVAVLATACASAQGPDTADTGTRDPIEPWNRGSFWLNDAVLDRWILGPIAHGWMFITPETVRVHLENVFENLNYPGYFVNDLLQGDPKQSGIETGRFVVNSTVGVLGIFDPAEHYLGWKGRPEDFGQTLGVWGVPAGAPVVLPVLAPMSSARDLAALPLDAVLLVGDSPFFGLGLVRVYGVSFVRDVNRRALSDANLRAAREAALDFYASARDAYRQRREISVRNGDPAAQEAPSDDLYEIEDDAP